MLEAEDLGLSIVSLAELYEGVIYSRDPSKNERERGRLRANKTLIGDFDLLIGGATAIRHGLVLLTNNRRHFEMIEGLQLTSQ